MSVIVMGIDYPKHCFRCRFKHSGISDYCIIEDRDFDDEDFDALVRDDWHPEWCPLRPLPEKHGRLIDADELEDIFYSVYHSQSAGYVKDMETIVEAEGE